MEVILIIVIILIFFKLQNKLYLKHAFKDVEFLMEFQDEAIFEGEETKLKRTFINRKFMPLWWLRTQYVLSANLEFDETQDDNNISKLDHRSEELSLFGHEKLEREIAIKGKKRGFYTINNAELITTDLFVTNKFVKRFDVANELYVFPKLLSNLIIDVKFEKLLGEVITRKHLVYDPYEKKGIRDYSTYDSIKDVNWSATARTGELKVNVYDYTSSQEVIIFLSSQKDNSWVSDDVIEEGIRIAATLYNEFTTQGIKVGLITDSVDRETNINISQEAGCEGDHGILFNRNLARISITENNENNIGSYINEEVLKGENQPLWIVISNNRGKDIVASIENAKANKFDVQWIIPKEYDVDALVENLDEVILWDVNL
ncbi:DUF58 domain-containing protein [Inconstantimicrobium mannanitabidum]|uniref:Uncharacterized protein n=1 Tax=Inconstantimicrobium mannanitabidum TaxID=1604901 RepID=A0ACB5RDI0_9CLOT|nr:DUF58 domain-containing protein [Clostridium sp. TW13]GKX67161.1 hypothetical protein rsdtw13_24190 [Clostridium sp. TW13]